MGGLRFRNSNDPGCPRIVYCSRFVLQHLTHYSAILEAYTIEDILELNDKTTEDCLEFLVEEAFISLPDVQPLEFE